MKHALTVILLLLAASASAVTAIALNDCFIGWTSVYNFNDEVQYCLELDFPYQNGQCISDQEGFYPDTRIEYLCPGARSMKLKGTSEVNNHIGISPGETIFIQANKGMVISDETFQEDLQVFQHVNPPSAYYAGIISDYDISVITGTDKRKVIYLAFRTWNTNWETAIGWIALEADSSIAHGDLRVIGSAFTTVGGPVTVGEAIPEFVPAVPPGVDPSGDYSALLEGGVRQTNIYVDASVAISGDGCSWQSPFKSIQEGVDAVRLNGTIVHVKPGIYAPVQIDNSKFTLNKLEYTFTVESTDGPHVTIIQGGQVSGTLTSGSASVHSCFWYSPSVALGYDYRELYDTLRGFTICGALHGCEYGRIENCIVSNCFLGVYCSTVVNSLLIDNIRTGVIYGKIYNCTSTRNGYGKIGSFAYNCIVVDNYEANDYSPGSFNYCCTTPMPESGIGNITNAPLFVCAEKGDFRLRAESPCIDAGTNEWCLTKTDFTRKRRIQGKHVDMGCYEYGAGTNGTTATTPVAVPYEWLTQYSTMPLNTSDDYEAAAMAGCGKTGASGSPLALWHEFVQGTVPTDSNDCFRASISLDREIAISFSPCRSDRRYILYGARLLTGPWTSTTAFTDSDFISTNRFFKVGVELQ